MNIKSIITVATLALSAAFTSCDKEPDNFYPEAKNLCGQWVCTAEIDGEVWASGFTVLTYNTAENNNQIWVSDKEFVGALEKATGDNESMTFSGENITNGAIFKDAVMVKPQELAGEPIAADSIDFTLNYTDDDGSYVIHYHGYRYTGWEDYIE